MCFIDIEKKRREKGDCDNRRKEIRIQCSRLILNNNKYLDFISFIKEFFVKKIPLENVSIYIQEE
jgi:hypothetical protein